MKRCKFIETAGRWPWKLDFYNVQILIFGCFLSAKKCVTTYLPNGFVLKMDNALNLLID